VHDEVMFGYPNRRMSIGKSINLQEHPNPKKLNIAVREMKCQYDEVRVTKYTLALALSHAKLWE